MLDSSTQAQLAAYFERIKTPIELIASLDDNEDVQNVYANYDMPAEWIEELASE